MRYDSFHPAIAFHHGPIYGSDTVRQNDDCIANLNPFQREVDDP